MDLKSNGGIDKKAINKKVGVYMTLYPLKDYHNLYYAEQINEFVLVDDKKQEAFIVSPPNDFLIDVSQACTKERYEYPGWYVKAKARLDRDYVNSDDILLTDTKSDYWRAGTRFTDKAGNTIYCIEDVKQDGLKIKNNKIDLCPNCNSNNLIYHGKYDTNGNYVTYGYTCSQCMLDD